MTSEPAPRLPQTCYPTVWLWPGQALYSGPGLGLAPHSGSVWCLAVGVDSPLTVIAAGTASVARSALIPPRLTHHLAVDGAMVSAYLDPSSPRTAACRAQFAAAPGIGLGHAAETELLVPPQSDADARRWLDIAAPAGPGDIDPRIAMAAKQIRMDPAGTASAADLAADAGLSESRFLHLFQHEAGTSLRRYRMWSRLIRAGALLASGANQTTAAVEAGFSSSSHLADRFKSTFGLSASALLSTGISIRTP